MKMVAFFHIAEVYTVYVLYSERYDKIYVGYTSDLLNRFYSHNKLSKKGWTKSFRPWKVVYCEYYEVKSEAHVRERALKSGRGRSWIRASLRTWL